MKKYFGIIALFVLNTGILLLAQQANPASDFVYDLNEEGTGILIKSYKGKNADVVIPSEIEEFPVVELGEGAFKYNRNITSIVVPNSVKKIGEATFSGCVFLTSVTLSNSLKEISDSAFDCCTSLSSITIPDSVEKISFYNINRK